MQAEERRRKIVELLSQTNQAVSAARLAAEFDVSRQVIVGDVALLRAAGEEISATPRGYVMARTAVGLVRQVPCCHDGPGMEAELNAIVDQGCSVLDVIVDHPVYGQLTGPLELCRRPPALRPHRRHPSAYPLLSQ